MRSHHTGEALVLQDLVIQRVSLLRWSIDDRLPSVAEPFPAIDVMVFSDLGTMVAKYGNPAAKAGALKRIHE